MEHKDAGAPRDAVERRRHLWCALVDGGRAATMRVLDAVGNGHESQYPIFPTRDEARAWKKRVARWPVVIVPCTVAFRVAKRRPPRPRGARA